MNCRPNHVARTFVGARSWGSSSSTSVMSCPLAVRLWPMRPRIASTVCSCSARTLFSGVNFEKSAYVRGRCQRSWPMVRISIRSSSFAESSPIPGSAVTGSSSELFGRDDERVMRLTAIDHLDLGARTCGAKALSGVLHARRVDVRARVQREELGVSEALCRIDQHRHLILAVRDDASVQERYR